jgi:LPS-assembly protein
MKSRFYRPVCWSVLLLCLGCNARAETPSPESKTKQERVAPPSRKESNGNKPVLIGTEPIQGHHEYESEARGDTGLRSSTISTGERPVSPPEGNQPRPQQNYTSPAAKSGPAKSGPAKSEPVIGVSPADAEHKESPSAIAAENVAEHAIHEGEPPLRTTTRAPSGVAAKPAPEESRLAMPGPERGRNRLGRTETDQIHGHFEQESDFRLRLGGQAEPETGTGLAAAGAPAEPTKNRPIFIAAERLQGHPGRDIEAVGKAELANGDQFISADRMKYQETTEDAEAEGSVRVEQRGDILEGSRLKFNLGSKTGELSQPNYRLKDASSRGHAEMLRFEGENNYRLQQATYTTCPAGDDSWFIQVADMEIDNSKKTGTARGVKLTFKDVPLFYTPWMNFSYSKERKSGLLAPTYGTNVKTGLELTIPFYWNIAPNYDATISARMMSKRGVALNNEFRYLTNLSSGTVLLDVLPHDLDTGHSRWRTSFWHNQNLTNGWWSRLDYNRVSDDTYFRDLGNNLNLTSRTNLLQQAQVGYSRNLGEEGTLNVVGMAQQFQTIQDPLATIISPYKRLPQVTVTAIKPDILGADFNFFGSGTNFSHPTLVSGQRVVLFPSVSYPMRSAFGYIIPKIGIHHTRYYLDDLNSSPGANPTRTLPLFSVDTGIAFDRSVSLRGEQFTQTLEPRLFYVYVPFRDQNNLPNFDSAKTDFSFAQMLTENRFSGSDRINDANQVTFALTSRLIEPGSGKERLRLAVGQQLSFIDRRITLDAPNTIGRRPDFIAAISGFLTPTITTDSSMQFDQRAFRTEVVRSGLSYRPEPGKVINVGYRFTRDVLHQVDASSQWRWTEKWQTVARINYSLQDHRILEGLAGLEYNACCWSLRFVLQHLTTATQKTTTAAFLQLELNGLMQIGSNPLQVLQRSIPGYTQTGSGGSSPVEGPQSGEQKLSQ